MFYKPVDVANAVDTGGLYVVIHFWVDKATHDAAQPPIPAEQGGQRLFLLPLTGLNPIPGQKDGRNLVLVSQGIDPDTSMLTFWVTKQNGDVVDPAILGPNDRVKVEEWDVNVTEKVRQTIERFWDRWGVQILAGMFSSPDVDAVIIEQNQINRTITDVRNLRSRFDSAALNGYEWRDPDSRPGDTRQNITVKNEKWADVEHLMPG